MARKSNYGYERYQKDLAKKKKKEDKMKRKLEKKSAGDVENPEQPEGQEEAV